MAAFINLEIIKPDKKLFKGMIDSITIPGTKGSFQVLKNHAPLLSTFEVGEIKVHVGDNSTFYATSGGTVEVLDNNILILADSIEAVENIDIERARKAMGRAKGRIEKKDPLIDLERAKNALNRSLNRLKLAEKHAIADF
jgi:F-type H+-transporting ATPase subunit epsilon